MYAVVFRTITECTTKGAITWTAFESKEHFEKWYSSKLQTWYEVVEQGVSEERAIELCSSNEAKEDIYASILRERRQLVDQLVEEIDQLIS